MLEQNWLDKLNCIPSTLLGIMEESIPPVSMYTYMAVIDPRAYFYYRNRVLFTYPAGRYCTYTKKCVALLF